MSAADIARRVHARLSPVEAERQMWELMREWDKKWWADMAERRAVYQQTVEDALPTLAADAAQALTDLWDIITELLDAGNQNTITPSKRVENVPPGVFPVLYDPFDDKALYDKLFELCKLAGWLSPSNDWTVNTLERLQSLESLYGNPDEITEG